MPAYPSLSLSLSRFLPLLIRCLSFHAHTHTHFYFFPFGPACVSAYLRNNFKNRHTYTHTYTRLAFKKLRPRVDRMKDIERKRRKRERGQTAREIASFSKYFSLLLRSVLLLFAPLMPPPLSIERGDRYEKTSAKPNAADDYQRTKPAAFVILSNRRHLFPDDSQEDRKRE